MEKIEEISTPDQDDIKAWIIMTQILGGLELLWNAEKTKKPNGKRTRVLSNGFVALNAVLDLYPNGKKFDLMRLGHICGDAAEAALNDAVGEGLRRYGHEVYVAPRSDSGVRSPNYAMVISTVSAVVQAMSDGRSSQEIDVAAKTKSGADGETARAIVALQKALVMKNEHPEIKKCSNCGEYFERSKKESFDRFQARKYCCRGCAN